MTCPHSTRSRSHFPCSQCLGFTARRVPVDHRAPVSVQPGVTAKYSAAARRGAAKRKRNKDAIEAHRPRMATR